MLQRLCLTTAAALTLTAAPAIAAETQPAAPTTAPQAHTAPTAPTVTQGDTIKVGGANTCTIGFNDPGQHVSYTAAHCGASGARVESDTPGGGRATGVFFPSKHYRKPLSGNDWGVIIWDEAVTVGPNKYSGNTVIDGADLAAGDQLCMYGVTSKHPLCGTYVSNLGNNVYWDGPGGRPGDSGGPVWAPGKGFVAIYTGSSEVTNTVTGDRAKLNRGSKPAEGREVTENEERDFIGSRLPKRVTVVPVTMTPAPDASHAQSSEGGKVAFWIALAVGLALAAPAILRQLPPELVEALISAP